MYLIHYKSYFSNLPHSNSNFNFKYISIKTHETHQPNRPPRMVNFTIILATLGNIFTQIFTAPPVDNSSRLSDLQFNLDSIHAALYRCEQESRQVKDRWWDGDVLVGWEHVTEVDRKCHTLERKVMAVKEEMGKLGG